MNDKKAMKMNQLYYSAALLVANLSNSLIKTNSYLLPAVTASYSTSKLWHKSLASSNKF